MIEHPKPEDQYPLTMAMLGKVLRDVRLATKIDASLNEQQVPWFTEIEPFQTTDIAIDTRAGEIIFTMPALNRDDMLSQLFMRRETYHDKIRTELREALAAAFPESYKRLLDMAAELELTPSPKEQDDTLLVRLKTNGYLHEFLDKAEEEGKRKLESIMAEVDNALIANSNRALMALPAPKPIVEADYPTLMAAMRQVLKQARREMGIDAIYDEDAGQEPVLASIKPYEEKNVWLGPNNRYIVFTIPVPDADYFLNNQTIGRLMSYREEMMKTITRFARGFIGKSWDEYAEPEMKRYYLDAQGNVADEHIMVNGDISQGTLPLTNAEKSTHTLYAVIQAKENLYEAFLKAAEDECLDKGVEVEVDNGLKQKASAFDTWLNEQNGLGDAFAEDRDNLDPDDWLGYRGADEHDRNDDDLQPT